jgi:hypothetical protein
MSPLWNKILKYIPNKMIKNGHNPMKFPKEIRNLSRQKLISWKEFKSNPNSKENYKNIRI